jgi:Na+/melibiose symporter-like transporter
VEGSAAEARAEAPAATALRASSIWVYGSLGFPLAMLGYPLGVWLPRAYASNIGISLAAIGAVIAAAAVFDAITDPAMGFASDRLRTRWGRRKTWVFFGAPLLTWAVWMLLNPTPGSSIGYLAFWYIFLRVGSTLLGVPYAAWGAELSGDYHTRTRLQSAREKFVILGLIGAALVPAGIEVYAGESNAMTVLRSYSWLVLFLLPSITLLVLARVPEPPASSLEGTTSFTQSLKLIWRNKLFRVVIAIELLIAGGEAFRNTLSLFFMQDAIGVEKVGSLYLLYFSAGLLAIPFWDGLARRFGKHRSLSGAMIVVSVVSISIFFLNPGQLRPFYVLFALKGFCFGAFAYLPRAMLADVVDIDTARSGDVRTGSYFAVLGFMTKCAASFGGLSLPILGWVGYDAMPQASNGPAELLWLGALYALVPTSVFGLALYLSWTWPLTAERHARLRSLIEARQIRIRARMRDSES